MDNRVLDEISKKIKELLANSPAADMQKNLRALLQAQFAKLDLVTREEFDVQREVLLRAREKITQLEARLAELERTQRKG
jgi:ubiquinone biosynthesis accessory factor UbiK